jgi:hypothetical protein
VLPGVLSRSCQEERFSSLTGLWIKIRFSPTTFPKAEKNSLKGQKGPLSSNSQPVSSHWKAFGKVESSFVQSPIAEKRRLNGK